MSEKYRIELLSNGSIEADVVCMVDGYSMYPLATKENRWLIYKHKEDYFSLPTFSAMPYEPLLCNWGKV